MTKFVIFLAFTFFLALFLIVGKKRTNSDFFSPFCFVNLYFYLTRIPRMLVANANLYQKEEITDLMLWKYFAVTLLFFVAMNLVFIVMSKNKRVIRKAKQINHNINIQKLIWVGVFFFTTGALIRVYEIVHAGGLRFVLHNLWNRTVLLSGLGYIDYFFNIFVMVGVCSAEICYLKRKQNIGYLFTFLLFTFLGSLLMLSFGARSGLMKMLLGILFVYYYCSPMKVSLKVFIKPKFVLCFLLVIVVLVVVPTFRRTNFDLSQIRLETILYELFNEDSSIINEISLFDEDVFTIDYFSTNTHWYGANYLNLLTAWIPRGLYTNKGIIDDGMYLRAIMKGYDIHPNMNLNDLYGLGVSSSVPFTTSGIFYANFGILGTVAGSLLTGLIIYKSYNKASSSRSMIDVLFYQFLCTRLCLSTKGIVELFMTYLIIKFVCGFVLNRQEFMVYTNERKKQKIIA